MRGLHDIPSSGGLRLWLPLHSVDLFARLSPARSKREHSILRLSSWRAIDESIQQLSLRALLHWPALVRLNRQLWGLFDPHLGLLPTTGTLERANF